MAIIRQALILACLLISPAWPSSANLVDLTQANPDFDGLERAAARANQAAFDALQPLCSVGGCNAAQQRIFENTRELVHNARQLLGTGTDPIDFSLNLNAEGLGDALRWTAVEEVSTQSTIATEFQRGQQANISSRMSALRWGARGFSVAGVSTVPVDPSWNLPADARLGSAGSADAISLGNWGGFLNVSHGFGEHDPTTFEDAFDYENTEATIGLDYRLNNRWTIGAVVGYTENEVDFNAALSIVDGGIESDGYSLGGFALYSGDALYASVALNYQSLDNRIDRFIKYPSFNPDIESTNTRTLGETESDTFGVSLNLGYLFRFGPGASKRFSAEPYLRLDYLDITIDDFTEVDSDGDAEEDYFAVSVAKQSFDSLEGTLGLRVSVALDVPFGVLIPYIRGETHREFEDSATVTEATYADIGVGLDGAALFALPAESIDDSWSTASFGFQTILRGGSEQRVGGPLGDRLSVFLEYRRVEGLENISNELYTGGFRYVF